MKNFNRGSRFGAKRGGGGFDRRDSGKRGFDRPQMHRAICSECGAACEVPFRPTGDKPIFCSNCFKGKDNRDNRGSRGDFGPKKMFSAVCDNCGKGCEVPFRPTGDKPVYCSDCFGGDHKDKTSHIEKQLQSINEKLDQLLQATVKPKVVKKAKTVKAKPKAKKTATKK